MLNKVFVSILWVFLLLAVPLSAAAIEGFRGSTWGEVKWDLPEEGENNLLVNGWIRQGADWIRWGNGNTALSTYLTLRFKSDSQKFDWNNSIGPGFGIAIDTYTEKGLVATAGIEYLWDRFYESDRTESKAVIYVNWFGWWDLKKK